ncbi:hypothetical protein ACFRMN_07840 [Streptomyces sp. NPDC056835]|uniref:hypothetical protein n=1 Tax=Streptomyces sp. NPDC056835 TaxID=3345956 RepID=UPI003673A116
MAADVSELVRVLKAMDHAVRLLREEDTHLHEVLGSQRGEDMSAGSPQQTLIGIGELRNGALESAERIALAIGYATAGLDKAAKAIKWARRKPITLPSGTERMARPLGERTVRALETVRDASAFFDGDIAAEIDVCLAAPGATYPPQDWSLGLRPRLIPASDG